MKQFVIIMGIMATIVGGISYSSQIGSTIKADNPAAVAATTTAPVEAPKDMLEEARKELERVNMMLDAEVSDIEKNKAKLEQEVAALNARLEEIRKIRTSF